MPTKNIRTLRLANATQQLARARTELLNWVKEAYAETDNVVETSRHVRSILSAEHDLAQLAARVEVSISSIEGRNPFEKIAKAS